MMALFVCWLVVSMLLFVLLASKVEWWFREVCKWTFVQDVHNVVKKDMGLNGVTLVRVLRTNLSVGKRPLKYQWLSLTSELFMVVTVVYAMRCHISWKSNGKRSLNNLIHIGPSPNLRGHRRFSHCEYVKQLISPMRDHYALATWHRHFQDVITTNHFGLFLGFCHAGSANGEFQRNQN